MSKFVALLDAIAKRPAMYVGRYSLRLVCHYLDGYDHALGDVGITPAPFAGSPEDRTLRERAPVFLRLQGKQDLVQKITERRQPRPIQSRTNLLDPLAVSHLCRSNPDATVKWPLVLRYNVCVQNFTSC